VGSYPAGQDDYPVSGVSWYEAAAYADFAGKSLPTVYHWYGASSMNSDAEILQASNFSGKGPAPVGSYPGLGPFGTYDMAGNVKEWCINANGDRRYILGGASTEPLYMYQTPDARVPVDRSPTNGFRLVKYLHTTSDEKMSAPVAVFNFLETAELKPVPGSRILLFAFTRTCIPTIARRSTPRLNPRTTALRTGGASASLSMLPTATSV
jgi:formylglycine-generating enzyme required for sulfatase activity